MNSLTAEQMAAVADAIASRDGAWRLHHTSQDVDMPDGRVPGYYIEKKRMVQHSWGKQATWEPVPDRHFDTLYDVAKHLGIV